MPLMEQEPTGSFEALDTGGEAVLGTRESTEEWLTLVYHFHKQETFFFYKRMFSKAHILPIVCPAEVRVVPVPSGDG